MYRRSKVVLGFPSLYKELSVNKERLLRAPNREKANPAIAQEGR